jgi:hypothetical protein
MKALSIWDSYRCAQTNKNLLAVSTGAAAAKEKKLRGGFDRATATTGTLIRSEDPLYAGSHTIECFVVKNGYCAARRGLFVVHIQ